MIVYHQGPQAAMAWLLEQEIVSRVLTIWSMIFFPPRIFSHRK